MMVFIFRLQCYRIKYITNKSTGLTQGFTVYVCGTRGHGQERFTELESDAARKWCIWVDDIIIYIFHSYCCQFFHGFVVIFFFHLQSYIGISCYDTRYRVQNHITYIQRYISILIQFWCIYIVLIVEMDSGLHLLIKYDVFLLWFPSSCNCSILLLFMYNDILLFSILQTLCF